MAHLKEALEKNIGIRMILPLLFQLSPHSLAVLFLDNNQIGNPGMNELSQGLRGNKVITTTLSFLIVPTFVHLDTP